MPADSAVLSVEFKVNMLAPASGTKFVARGRIVRAGKTITVVRGEVIAIAGDGTSKVVLELLGTMMTVRGNGLTD